MPHAFKDLYESAEIVNSLSNDPSDNMYEMIIKDEHAYVEWHDSLDLIMKERHKLTGKCDFELAAEKFLTQRLAFAFSKDNPWIEKFNKE